MLTEPSSFHVPLARPLAHDERLPNFPTIGSFFKPFRACLMDESWLPKTCLVPYEIETSRWMENRADPIPARFAFSFVLTDGQKRFAQLEVASNSLVREDKDDRQGPGKDALVITSIMSGMRGTPYAERSCGLGRELVRRAVLFAFENGYRRVRTSVFVQKGASFWLGHGFNSVPYLKPERARTPERRAALRSLKNAQTSPAPALWAFAKTDEGRSALEDADGLGLLSFDDKTQLTYAAQQLRLPPARLGL